MSPPATGFAGPLKGAPLVARQSRFHGGRWVVLMPRGLCQVLQDEVLT